MVANLLQENLILSFFQVEGLQFVKLKSLWGSVFVLVMSFFRRRPTEEVCRRGKSGALETTQFS